MQEHLFRHFKNESHDSFLRNVSITLVGNTDGKEPERKQSHGIFWGIS